MDKRYYFTNSVSPARDCDCFPACTLDASYWRMANNQNALLVEFPVGRRYYAHHPDHLVGDCDSVPAGTLIGNSTRMVNNQTPLVIEIEKSDE